MAKDENLLVLDGRTIARKIASSKDSPERLAFWAGMAAARLEQYQRALEDAGIDPPEPG